MYYGAEHDTLPPLSHKTSTFVKNKNLFIELNQLKKKKKKFAITASYYPLAQFPLLEYRKFHSTYLSIVAKRLLIGSSFPRSQLSEVSERKFQANKRIEYIMNLIIIHSTKLSSTLNKIAFYTKHN